jgi:hypothetical protein
MHLQGERISQAEDTLLRNVDYNPTRQNCLQPLLWQHQIPYVVAYLTDSLAAMCRPLSKVAWVRQPLHAVAGEHGMLVGNGLFGVTNYDLFSMCLSRKQCSIYRNEQTRPRVSVSESENEAQLQWTTKLIFKLWIVNTCQLSRKNDLYWEKYLPHRMVSEWGIFIFLHLCVVAFVVFILNVYT